MTMAPNIQIEDYRRTAWYGSGTCWVKIEGKFEPTYQIYVACSEGALTLRKTDHRCIPMANSRPSALRTTDGDDIGTLGIGCAVL